MDLDHLSLDRIPLPSLKVYFTLSSLAASFSLYYFWIESSISELTEGQNFPIYSRTMEHQYQQEEVIFSASYDTFKNYYKASYSSEGQIIDMNNTTPGISTNATSSDVILLDSSSPLSWHAIRWASQQPHCVWVR